MILPSKKVDFLAREEHHIKHALAVYDALPEQYKGNFCTSREQMMNSNNAVVFVAAYGDLKSVHDAGKLAIFADHGVGMYYNNPHPSYAGSLSHRDCVILRLSPNEIHAKKEREILKCPVEVIGVPKMDRWAGQRDNFTQRNVLRKKRRTPIVAISFHWDCHVCPETRTAYYQFLPALKTLANHFRVIGHAHPRIAQHAKRVYLANGIPFVKDFSEVMKKADVYVCDNSSTIFEFAYLNKPVVLMNSSHYRKFVHHEGNPRFWRHADIGPQADSPEQLLSAVYEAIAQRDAYLPKIKNAVEEMFAFTDGKCTERAVNAIIKAMENPFMPVRNPYQKHAKGS